MRIIVERPRHVLAGVAAACALCTAHAQSSVTLYGIVDAYVARSVTPGTASSTALLGSGGMATSVWGLRGKEDLGGGRSAQFVLESFFRPDTGAAGRVGTDPLFSRNAYVSLLDDNLGQLRVGRITNPYFLAAIRSNPFADSTTFAPVLLQSYIPNGSLNPSITGDTSWNNAVSYTTPELGGVSASAMYSFGEKAGDTSKNKFGFNALYIAGKVVAVASYIQLRFNATPDGDVNVPPGFGKQQAFLAGGSYDFGFVRAFAQYQRITTDATTDVRRNGGQAGVSIPLGRGSVLASYAYMRSTVGNAPQSRNTWTVGYDFNLSKRTDLYANYLSDRASGVSSGSLAAIGMRHRF